MGKSLGNFITLNEFFQGSHIDSNGKEMLEQAYSPMTIRFFVLQAHYRGTVDFSNEALQSAERVWKNSMPLKEVWTNSKLPTSPRRTSKLGLLDVTRL